jgi:transposase, IS5 family
MSQTKKGSQWYFGMRAHIGMDAKIGLLHTTKTTTAKVHDAKMTNDLIRDITLNMLKFSLVGIHAN